MGYKEQRDGILVHAKAAAAAVDAEWKDVSIGAPFPRGRSVRIFYGGEREPVRMGASRVLNGELVSEVIVLEAYWPTSGMGENELKALDDQMYDFKHELRTRVLGDSQLGGVSTDLEMGYVDPGWSQIGGTTYIGLRAEFTTDFTEYPIAA